MNFKRILIFIVFIAFKYSAFSQVEATPKSKFWEKVRYGGRANVGFSNRSTNIVLAPAAIYQFNPKIGLGGSVSFGYANFRDANISQINYGASAIFNYTPIRELLLSAELEQTFVNRTIEIAGSDVKDNFSFPAFYLGAGYRLGRVSVGFRYDVLFNENRNIYNSALTPFVGVFF